MFFTLIFQKRFWLEKKGGLGKRDGKKKGAKILKEKNFFSHFFLGKKKNWEKNPFGLNFYPIFFFFIVSLKKIFLSLLNGKGGGKGGKKIWVPIFKKQ